MTIAAVLGIFWTRFLAALAGLALILGIGTEVISIVTGYYNMQRAKSEAAIADANAKAATATAKGVASSVVLPPEAQVNADVRNRHRRLIEE
jgi:Na+(H+)/acetate symporter ActP